MENMLDNINQTLTPKHVKGSNLLLENVLSK